MKEALELTKELEVKEVQVLMARMTDRTKELVEARFPRVPVLELTKDKVLEVRELLD